MKRFDLEHSKWNITKILVYKIRKIPILKFLIHKGSLTVFNLKIYLLNDYLSSFNLIIFI